MNVKFLCAIFTAVAVSSVNAEVLDYFYLEVQVDRSTTENTTYTESADSEGEQVSLRFSLPLIDRFYATGGVSTDKKNFSTSIDDLVYHLGDKRMLYSAGLGYYWEQSFDRDVFVELMAVRSETDKASPIFEPLLPIENDTRIGHAEEALTDENTLGAGIGFRQLVFGSVEFNGRVDYLAYESGPEYRASTGLLVNLGNIGLGLSAHVIRHSDRHFEDTKKLVAGFRFNI